MAISDLLGGYQTYAEAFFLQSTNVPSCLQDNIYRLEKQQDLLNADSDTNEVIHMVSGNKSFFVNTNKV